MILHPQTKKQLAVLESDPPHATLLYGAEGVGLATIARHLAGQNLAAWLEPHAKSGSTASRGAIFVEDIRSLYDQTKTGAASQRFIVIDDADCMTIAAQNAFLKLLEEPPRQTHFVLTSHTPDSLLVTVRSRVQTIAVLPIDSAASQNFIGELITETQKRAQIEFIASGRPAEIMRLAYDSEYFAVQANLARQARDFLSGNPYQQLKIANDNKDDRRAALALIDMTCMLAQRALENQPRPALVQRLTKLLQAREALVANGNPRLHLMRAVV